MALSSASSPKVGPPRSLGGAHSGRGPSGTATIAHLGPAALPPPATGPTSPPPSQAPWDRCGAGRGRRAGPPRAPRHRRRRPRRSATAAAGARPALDDPRQAARRRDEAGACRRRGPAGPGQDRCPEHHDRHGAVLRSCSNMLGLLRSKMRVPTRFPGYTGSGGNAGFVTRSGRQLQARLPLRCCGPCVAQMSSIKAVLTISPSLHMDIASQQCIAWALHVAN